MIEDSTLQRQFARPTGPGAGVIKYDVITALSVMALHQGPTQQTTVLRLVALLTARYNWKLDQFCVAQSEMARMWNVSERTVKREIKRMVETGLLRCIRQGVRGRVGAYRLDYSRLFDQSRDSWSAVGVDFEDRMQATTATRDAKVVKVDFGPRPVTPVPDMPEGDDLWPRVLRALAQSDPDNLRNWYMKLRLGTVQDGRVTVDAPSGFVASFVQTHLAAQLSEALAREMGQGVRLSIRY